MIEAHFISAKTICTQYGIEISFVHELVEFGLITLEFQEEEAFIHQDQIGDLEKILRLQQDLNLNLEAIDVIFNLLRKEKALKEELAILRNRLKLYE
ncbi:hypothetical protein FHS59_001316 [Algoriphagus iocasae]|jgi:chaperone modulatory protein CbpM|uniref:MerR family transcriptional regulator n=1 Tax=Algoriphagus iocasae TaxID=1836499 RepID=A0A841MUK8_9BACT|nr:chaperone modulator CbpM [Algoriphagus iocasae]MBB6325701.1 hypothetical protein [Algoriphagus iocasae]